MVMDAGAGQKSSLKLPACSFCCTAHGGLCEGHSGMGPLFRVGRFMTLRKRLSSGDQGAYGTSSPAAVRLGDAEGPGAGARPQPRVRPSCWQGRGLPGVTIVSRLPAATPPLAQAQDHLSWRPALWPLVRSPVCRGWGLTGLQAPSAPSMLGRRRSPLHAYGSF